jgi:hypothetical protein
VLLETVKVYIVDVWEIRKARLYGDNPDVQQSQSQCSSGDLGDVAGRDGKLGCPVGKSGHPVGKLGVICVCNSGSAHNCGCVVNGRNARAAI